MAYVLTTYPWEGERRKRKKSHTIGHQGKHTDSYKFHHLLLLGQDLLLLGQLLLLLAHQSLHVLTPSPFFCHLILRCSIYFVMIVATENIKCNVHWGGKRTHPALLSQAVGVSL
jgi:hypothetical protein